MAAKKASSQANARADARAVSKAPALSKQPLGSTAAASSRESLFLSLALSRGGARAIAADTGKVPQLDAQKPSFSQQRAAALGAIHALL